MKLNKKLIFGMFILTLAAGITFALILLGPYEETIGGDTDNYGCLTAAGYRWCDATQKCQRFWEELCPGYEDEYRTPKITSETTDVSEGIVQRTNEENVLTPEDCTQNNGHIVNVVAGDYCKEYEYSIGEVVGFISPAVCCVAYP